MYQKEGPLLQMLRGTIVVFAVLFGSTAFADESIKETSQKLGHDVRDIGKETVKATAKAGKEAGHTFKEAGKEVGQEAKKTGKTVGETFRNFGRKAGEAFKEMGRSILAFFTRSHNN
jgi:hypothetical protein